MVDYWKELRKAMEEFSKKVREAFGDSPFNVRVVPLSFPPLQRGEIMKPGVQPKRKKKNFTCHQCGYRVGDFCAFKDLPIVDLDFGCVTMDDPKKRVYRK